MEANNLNFRGVVAPWHRIEKAVYGVLYLLFLSRFHENILTDMTDMEDTFISLVILRIIGSRSRPESI